MSFLWEISWHHFKGISSAWRRCNNYVRRGRKQSWTRRSNFFWRSAGLTSACLRVSACGSSGGTARRWRERSATHWGAHPLSTLITKMSKLWNPGSWEKQLNQWKGTNLWCWCSAQLFRCISPFSLQSDNHLEVCHVVVSGKVVNFVKSENFLAIRLEDLAGLESAKDKDSRSLLFHIVRKTVESQESFSGFSTSFIDTLTSMIRQKILQIKRLKMVDSLVL